MTKKTEDSMLFWGGIFGSVTGVERLLSSTSYSSSSAYLSMTPEILGVNSGCIVSRDDPHWAGMHE